MDKDLTKLVLILGSAPDAMRAQELDLGNCDAIVAMNNAWRIRKDWSHLVHPEDFPADRRPIETKGQGIVTHEAFVPANNVYGGVIYAGGTMAFTTAYWALHVLKPDILAFLGCDMIYDDENGQSHFYGEGEADPLRDDPTLQCLEAKSQRLRYFALQQGCWCANLSNKERSRLTFDRIPEELFADDLTEHRCSGLMSNQSRLDQKAATMALSAEERAGCVVESGDYWNFKDCWDSEKLKTIDDLWLEVFKPFSGE